MTAAASPIATKKSAAAATRANGPSAPLARQQAVVDDTSAKRSRQILAAMLAFRDGNFTVRLPMDWEETDGRIAETFNQTIAQKQRTTSEVLRLSASVGKEGRLRQRMSLPGALGEWAVEAQAFNDLIDDLVRPTTEIADHRRRGQGRPRAADGA